MKLYEISNEYQSILEEAMGDDEELTEELIQSLDAVQSEFDNKAIAIASYIKNLEAEQDAIGQAMDGMKKRKESLSKKIDSLTDYLQFNLQSLNINEIKSSPYFKIKLKACPASVEISNEQLIPAEYMREKVTIAPDKVKIKEVLNEGIEVPGCALQRKIKLEIK